MNSEGPIDARQLQIFLSVASKGSLKAAAMELCLTNSAISHSIAKLEETLGVQLFHRASRGLLLTSKGELLYRKAVPVVAQMKRIQTMLRGEEVNERGQLRVAAGYTFVTYLAPDIVTEFNDCFPHPGLRLRAAERDEALRLVTQGQVDAAVMVNPPEEDSDLAHERLFQDEYRLLVGAGQSLAALEAVPVRSLAQKTLIVSRAQSYTVRSLLAQLRRRNVEFRDCFEVGNTATLLEMVKLGQGIALVPDWIFRFERPVSTLALRPLADFHFIRSWAYVFPRWMQPTSRARTFLRLCRQSACRIEPGKVLEFAAA